MQWSLSIRDRLVTGHLSLKLTHPVEPLYKRYRTGWYKGQVGIRNGSFGYYTVEPLDKGSGQGIIAWGLIHSNIVKPALMTTYSHKVHLVMSQHGFSYHTFLMQVALNLVIIRLHQ